MLRMRRHDFERRSTRLARAQGRLLATHPQRQLLATRERVDALAGRLRNHVLHRIERQRAHLAELARALHAVSPLATLGRGYAILVDQQTGAVIRSVVGVDSDTRLRGILVDGELKLRVDGGD